MVAEIVPDVHAYHLLTLIKLGASRVSTGRSEIGRPLSQEQVEVARTKLVKNIDRAREKLGNGPVDACLEGVERDYGMVNQDSWI